MSFNVLGEGLTEGARHTHPNSFINGHHSVDASSTLDAERTVYLRAVEPICESLMYCCFFTGKKIIQICSNGELVES
jgi:hypothetical protein